MNDQASTRPPVAASTACEADRVGRARLEKLRRDVIGLDTCYRTVDGATRRRIYLDSAATSLRLGVVQKVLDRFQPHYANTHSTLHCAARVSTIEYAWAHRMVLAFVDADPARWMCFFTGSGATAGINRVARTLRQARPGRDVVVTSAMEHHSNDLPHRKHAAEVVHVPSRPSGRSLGGVDMETLRAVLELHGPRVNYVALTGVSNVTGYVNPIHDVAALAHRQGALIVVDAAQMIAHTPVRVSDDLDPERDLDVVVFSGHKAYAPGSPGVVVARSDLFAGIEPEEVGGGMVDTVWLDRYTLSGRFPEREEAGTPNIPGAIGLAAALYALQSVGMERVAAEERALMTYALQRLSRVPDIVVYGPADCGTDALVGVVAFNLAGCDHAFTTAVLNDYFNIAVRNECFCAHPYVREMVTRSLEEVADRLSNEDLERWAERHRGMVRASFGVYSTPEDVDALVSALCEIAARRDELLPLYERLDNGDYRHRRFAFDAAAAFSVCGTVDEALSTSSHSP